MAASAAAAAAATATDDDAGCLWMRYRCKHGRATCPLANRRQRDTLALTPVSDLALQLVARSIIVRRKPQFQLSSIRQKHEASLFVQSI